MSLDDIIETIDKYCVDYIRFILSVTNRSVFSRRSGELDQKIITFSIISVVLGDYLYTTYVSDKIYAQTDTLPRLVTEFSLWLAMSMVAYIGVNVGRKPLTRYTGVLIAVLRVMPAAFVLSCYLGAAINSLAKLFVNVQCAPWWAYFATLASRVLILLIYLPFALARIGGGAPAGAEYAGPPSRIRARLVGFGVISTALVVDLVMLGTNLVASADSAAAPVVAALKVPQSAQKRQALAEQTSDPVLSQCLARGSACDVQALEHSLFQEQMRGIKACLIR